MDVSQQAKQTSSHIKISFPNGLVLPLSEIERDRTSREKYLAKYHGNDGQVLCLCRREGIPLGVGMRQVPYVVYYFYPLHRSDPPRHALGCPHRAEPGQGAQPSASGTPTIEVKEGIIQVNLASPLYRTQPTGPRAQSENEEGGSENIPSSTAARGKLKTLLEVIWSEAELNAWRPWFAGKRFYGVVYHRVTEAVAKIHVRRQELSPLLYMPRPFREIHAAEIQAQRQQYIERLVENDGRRYYGYVLALLKEVVEKDGHSVALRLAHTSLLLWMKKPKWLSAKKKWFTADDLQLPAVLLARVVRQEGHKHPWLAVEDLAIMHLSDDKAWIPVDSLAERRLALKLVSDRRAFRKPLACETAGSEIYPDFILEDREDRMHLEVLGRMGDAEYYAQYQEKRLSYEKLKQPVWWWDIARDDQIPPLPVAKRNPTIVRAHAMEQLAEDTSTKTCDTEEDIIYDNPQN